MSDDRSAFHDKFRDLQASFVARMKRGADQLETSIQKLHNGGGDDATALADVRQAVHRMAGAASTASMNGGGPEFDRGGHAGCSSPLKREALQ